MKKGIKCPGLKEQISSLAIGEILDVYHNEEGSLREYLTNRVSVHRWGHVRICSELNVAIEKLLPTILIDSEICKVTLSNVSSWCDKYGLESKVKKGQKTGKGWKGNGR